MGLFRGSNTTMGKREWIRNARSSKWFVQLTVGMAVFTDIFLYAVIVPVMPFALETRTHIKDQDVQSWVSILIAVYGASLALVSPLCGWAADHTESRKVPLVLGLISLGGATILLEVGQSIGILILGRVLQGTAAAVVWVAGLALLGDTVPQAEIGQSMGIVFLGMSLGVLIGPLFGGIIFERLGYDAVFALAYAFIALDLVLPFFLVVPKKPLLPETPDSDASSLASEITAEEQKDEEAGKKNPKPEHTEQAPKDQSAKGKTTTSIEFLGQAESPAKTQTPALIVLIRSRRLVSCLWGVMITAILVSQFDSVLPLHVNDVFHWDSTAAGLVFLPITLTAFLSPLVGWGVDRYGPRWFATVGFLSLAPFEALLSIITVNNIGQKVLLCVLLGLIGVSLDLAITPLLVEVTAVIEAKEAQDPGVFGPKGAVAQAYGLFNFAWALGSLIGPIWAGFVNERAGWKTMTFSLAILSLVTVIPETIWTGGSIFNAEKRRKSRQRKVRVPKAVDFS